MKIFLVSIFVTLLTFGFFVNEAAAKRFGGGRSFGVQRSYNSLFTKQPTKTFAQQAKTSKWGGVLGGMLAGGLLASLFMGHGLGAGMMSWLLIGGLAFLLFSFLRKKMPNAAAANANPFGQANTSYQPSQFSNEQGSSSGYSSNYSSNNTEGFEAESFLREAKVTFLRLQTAYDQKNKQDLCEFTAPEVFAEIEMQLNERGDAPNKTEVMDLKAELLDVSKQVDSTMVSVRFTGYVKENDEPMSPLDEIWHFRQFAGTKNWVVGGIQQEVITPN